MDIHLNIGENDAAYFRRVTGEPDASRAVASFIKRLVHSRGTGAWRTAREKALGKYRPSPEAIRGALNSLAELRGTKTNVSRPRRKPARARNSRA